LTTFYLQNQKDNINKHIVAMKFFLLCKRYYTNKDLIADRFGRLFHLPVQLSKNGHQGIVVAADYRNKKSEKLEISNLTFYSVPFNFIFPALFLFKIYRLFKQYQPDIIIASGDSHFGAIGLFLAKIAKIPFVFDVYDHYAVFGTNKVPGMKWLYYLALRKADLVVCASVPLSHFIRQYNQSVTVIENGVDLSLFKPIDKHQARAHLGIAENAVVIGFFGSITKNRGVELIEACKILRRTYPNIKLLLAGKLSISIDEDAPWIDYRGIVAQSEVVIMTNACDIVTIPYLADDFNNMSNACKIAEYLACGVPVVTTRVANYADIFATAPEAVCEPGNPKDMSRAISAQIQSPQIVAFPKNLTWEELGKKLFQVLSTI